MKYLHIVPILLMSCASAVGQCAGGLVVVVNKANPTDSLSMPQLRKLMLGDAKSWPDHKQVLVVNRVPASEVGKCVLGRLSE